jgi:hypothetical protein
MADKNERAVHDRRARKANRDPISEEKGAHPVGTAAGAASGAAAGAMAGTAVGGPIGMAVGGVAGAVVGGLAGKGVAEAVNPTLEDEYWRNNYSSRPYTNGKSYETFQPAYRYGWESRANNIESEWEDVEPDLEDGWEDVRGESRLAWDEARQATRDAWEHVGDGQERMLDEGAPLATGSSLRKDSSMRSESSIRNDESLRDGASSSPSTSDSSARNMERVSPDDDSLNRD